MFSSLSIHCRINCSVFRFPANPMSVENYNFLRTRYIKWRNFFLFSGSVCGSPVQRVHNRQTSSSWADTCYGSECIKGDTFHHSVLPHFVIILLTLLTLTFILEKNFEFYVVILSFSYEERYKALETITQNLQEPATFEDFCAQLCCPGVPMPTGGSSGNLSGKRQFF